MWVPFGSDKKVLKLIVGLVVQLHGCTKNIEFLTLNGFLRKYMSYINKTVKRRIEVSKESINLLHSKNTNLILNPFSNELSVYTLFTQGREIK